VLNKGRAKAGKDQIAESFNTGIVEFNPMGRNTVVFLLWVEHCGSMVQVSGHTVNGSFICKEQEVQGICAAQKLEEMLRLRRLGLG